MLAKPCPGNRVMRNSCIWLLNCFRPVCWRNILYLVGDHGSVRYCTLKGMERKNILSTEGNCCIADSESWSTDLYTVIARDKVPNQSHYEIPRFARNDKAVKLFS